MQPKAIQKSVRVIALLGLVGLTIANTAIAEPALPDEEKQRLAEEQKRLEVENQNRRYQEFLGRHPQFANRPDVKQFSTRWLIRRDMSQVLSLGRQELGAEARDEDGFMVEMRGSKTIASVVEDPATGRIAGYAMYELVGGALVIKDFVVDHEFASMGAGAQLADALMQKLNERRQQITFKPGPLNEEAMLHFQAVGLEKVSEPGSKQVEFVKKTDGCPFKDLKARK